MNLQLFLLTTIAEVEGENHSWSQWYEKIPIIIQVDR